MFYVGVYLLTLASRVWTLEWNPVAEHPLKLKAFSCDRSAEKAERREEKWEIHESTFHLLWLQ